MSSTQGPAEARRANQRPHPIRSRGGDGIGISASPTVHTHIRATAIMSNPNDPRDASLETRVTFPKSWSRDEAG